MGSAPSMASQPAAGAEAGVALVPTSEDPEVEEIKRDLSAQLGRGASTLGHAASFGESSGPATVLKAWLGLTHAPFSFVYFSILPTYTYYRYIYMYTHIYIYMYTWVCYAYRNQFPADPGARRVFCCGCGTASAALQPQEGQDPA